MIASKQQSPRYGPGRLVVDGRDRTVVRKATFAFRPTKAQAGRLHGLLRVCCEVYNAALQERRDAWRVAGKTVRWRDQFVALTGVRQVRPNVFAYGLQPLRGAIMRCDEAMQAFFDRVGRGARPGFPRFKGHRRFNTACWDEPASWKVDAARRTLYLQGVGTIRLPKSARRQIDRMTAAGGRPTTLSVTRRRAGTGWVWRATVAFKDVAVNDTPPAEGEGSLVGADRGITVTVATSDGQMLTMPRHVAAARQQIVELQRAQARCIRGSREWRRLGAHIARARRKAANQVDNWAREHATRLVADHRVLVLEDLPLNNMMRSASGTVEEPGTNVAQKQGLNRELQDVVLGKLASRICVKAESAGRRVWMVRPENTSRGCSRCGHTAKANRPDQAAFRCVGCGFEANADLNAAVNVAGRGREAEDAWQDDGAPSLVRPRSRRRRATKNEPDRTKAA